jgi:hypothetical protein
MRSTLPVKSRVGESSAAKEYSETFRLDDPRFIANTRDDGAAFSEGVFSGSVLTSSLLESRPSESCPPQAGPASGPVPGIIESFGHKTIAAS